MSVTSTGFSVQRMGILLIGYYGDSILILGLAHTPRPGVGTIKLWLLNIILPCFPLALVFRARTGPPFRLFNQAFVLWIEVSREPGPDRPLTQVEV